jgi:hypothetical protein
MRVYVIKTDITEEEDNIITSNLTTEEKMTSSEYSSEVFIFEEVDKYGCLIIYIICQDKHINFLKSLGEKYHVKLDVQDITEPFMEGFIDIDDREFIEYRKKMIRNKK